MTRRTTRRNFLAGALFLALAAHRREPAAAETTYVWVTGAWSECSAQCGGGFQVRTATCVDTTTGNVVADANCVDPKPVTEMACNSQPCPTYAWMTGAWSECSAQCGGGYRVRTATCVDTTTGNVVADANCVDPKPVTEMVCNSQPCPTYAWMTGAWSECSAQCGGGYQVRTATCVDTITGNVVADANCVDPKPVTEMACNSQPCETQTSTATDTPADTVTPSPSPTPTIFVGGRVLYYAGSRPPVPGVSVVGSSSLGGPAVTTVQSDSHGLYTMPAPDGQWAVQPNRAEITAWPQANLSRGLSSLDATWIQQHMIAIRTFSASQLLAADTTGDGTVSSLDVTRIQEWRIHRRERLPVSELCGSDWAFLPTPDPQGNPVPVVSSPPCIAGAISYASLSGSTAGQNFEAVLYGDVTGNWTPSGGGSTGMEALSGAAVEEALDSEALSMPAPSCEAPCALVSGTAIPVNLAGGVQAFDLNAVLPAGVEVTAVRKAQLPAAAGDCSLEWSAQNGVLRVSLACVTPLRGGGALLSVEAQGAASGIRLSKCVFDEAEVPCGGGH